MLDAKDWAVIEVLQDGIPLESRPYDVLADRAGMPVGGLLDRVRRLREQGVIRRMGVRVRHHRAGIEGNVLTAWRVPDDDLERVGRLFAAAPEVSHCYARATCPEFPYRLYAMVHAKTMDEAQAIVGRLARESGIGDFVTLRTLRELKKSTPRYRRPSG